MSKSNDNASEELFDKRTFASVCAYLAILLSGSCAALLFGGTTAAHFAAFDDMYCIVIILQALFGVFVIPHILLPATDYRTALANLTLLYASGTPLVAVGAFSSAALWHKMIFSQMVIFGLWLLAFWFKDTLRRKFSNACLYIPIAAVLFTGTALSGSVLAGLSDASGTYSGFSVPGVLYSWAAGDYFDANGWLGMAVCLGALAIWSKKLVVSQNH